MPVRLNQLASDLKTLRTLLLETEEKEPAEPDPKALRTLPLETREKKSAEPDLKTYLHAVLLEIKQKQPADRPDPKTLCTPLLETEGKKPADNPNLKTLHTLLPKTEQKKQPTNKLAPIRCTRERLFQAARLWARSTSLTIKRSMKACSGLLRTIGSTGPTYFPHLSPENSLLQPSEVRLQASEVKRRGS
jgi:hypothetical protein